MTTKALVMDFFGVICSEVAPFWFAEHFPADRAAAIKHELCDRLDRGRMSLDELFASLTSLTGVPAATISDEWRRSARVDRRFVDLLQSWRTPDRRLGLLTNASSTFVRRIIDEHHLDRLFDAIVVSSEIGCAKPDAEAYQTILRALNVAAADAMMVDDNPVNVEGARAVGMQGLLFRSFEQFRDDAFSEDDMRRMSLR